MNLRHRSITVFFCFVFVAAASAHDDLHTQVEEASRHIAKDPGNASLYVKRAEIYRLLGHPQHALADLKAAEHRDPALPGITLTRGRVLSQLGRLQAAKNALDALLRQHPDHLDGLSERGRVLERLRLYRAAAIDLGRACRLRPVPSPDDCAEAAQAWQRAGDSGAALKSLDDCMLRIGAVATLQPLAIHIEMVRGDYESALARQESMQQHLASHQWLAERAELLQQIGRRSEAHQVRLKALIAFNALPPDRRQTRMGTSFRRDLELALQQEH
jgi:predicted Zn-dependent protease